MSKPNCSCLFYNLKDKKLKEQEKKGEILHRQLPKKTEKSPVSYRQPSSCLISQIQNTKALLKDRKVTKAGAQEKGQWRKASGGSVCACVVWCAVPEPVLPCLLCVCEQRLQACIPCLDNASTRGMCGNRGSAQQAGVLTFCVGQNSCRALKRAVPSPVYTSLTHKTILAQAGVLKASPPTPDH